MPIMPAAPRRLPMWFCRWGLHSGNLPMLAANCLQMRRPTLQTFGRSSLATGWCSGSLTALSRSSLPGSQRGSLTAMLRAFPSGSQREQSSRAAGDEREQQIRVAAKRRAAEKNGVGRKWSGDYRGGSSDVSSGNSAHVERFLAK
jgi:hypothetical protein